MSNIQQSINDYEKMLLNATQYSGNSKAGTKKYSASMLGNNVLQNYLKIMNGSTDKPKFGANSIGSLYQLGVDEATRRWNELEPGRYEFAKRLEYTLPNGWVISGEMDQIDMELKVIFDNKVSTATTISKIRSEGKTHGYALQLAVYKWLMWKEYGELYQTALPVVDKGHSFFKTNKNECLENIEVFTYEPEDIELMLIEKTDELQTFVDLGQEPEMCTDLWIMARKGSAPKRMKCLYYCDQNKNCKHYNVDYNAVNTLLDL